jgi:hypothetical protein
MQGDPYNRLLIHENLQQLCTGETLVIRLSLAWYTTRKSGMLSVILARVSVPYPRLYMFERLGYPALSPTSKIVQLADASIRHPKGILHLHGFCGPWYAGWCGNAAHSWEVIPKWRKGRDQCGKCYHSLPHWEELDVPISNNIRAMLFSARKWWANWGMGGGTTPAQANSDRTKKVKENTEGVVGGTEVTPLYFSGVGWRVELITEKSLALGLKMVITFAKR